MSRHDSRLRHEDEARRRLKAGIATVALRHRRTRPAVDSYGHPLARAVEMADRHNERTLERWAAKRTRTIVVMG